MIGGLKLGRGWGFVAGAAATFAMTAASPSFAADLGGNCCADLEERIAELEATTVRKGNRKVSLEVSGHVNETLLFWDDGFERNAGVYTNDNARTRFRFKGKAKINADWEAGYNLEIGVRSANSKRFNQDDDNAAAATDVGLDLRDSNWYIKNKSLGQLNVGLQGTATDAVTEINQTQTADFSKYSDVEDSGLGLKLRNSATGLKSERYQYRRLIGVNGDQPGEGERRFNGVKYATPEFAGFSASAFWGEDDFWDIALRYKGEFGGFKVAGGIGYGELSDGPDTKTGCNAAIGNGSVAGGDSDADCNQFGGSVSVIHAQSGLFVNFASGIKRDDLIDDLDVYAGAITPDDEETFWAVQAGIERKWIEYGKTTIYAEYYDLNGGSNNRTIENSFATGGAGNAAVLSTELQSFGFGVAQGFDAAALTLYVSYRHVEAELETSAIVAGVAAGAVTDVPLEDLDIFLAGGIIKF
ncbi:MAG: hypothetical protein ACT4OU_09195 [Hyphomicrobium sp.]